MYVTPPQGHLQGQIRGNSNTFFLHTKKEHINMCFHNSVEQIYLCYYRISGVMSYLVNYHNYPNIDVFEASAFGGSLTLKVTLWGYHIRAAYRANFSKH